MKSRHLYKIFLMLFSLSLAAVPMQAEEFSADEEATSVSIKDLDSPPKPEKQDKPSIPPALRKIQASIQVGFIIDESGNVVAPRIVKSTDDRLNDVALDCVASWKFVPGEKDGNKVKVRVVVPLRFK